MTVLILAQKRIAPFLMIFPAGATLGRFQEINSKGWVTVLSGVVITISLALYIFSLYGSFGLGFKIRSHQAQVLELQNTVLNLELKLEKKQTDFTEEYKDVVESMEKISAIRYISAESVASSRLAPYHRERPGF